MRQTLIASPRVLVIPGLGDWIAGLLRRKARIDGRRITKGELAGMAGISRETLYRALSKDEVTPAIADSFAQALGVTSQTLLSPGSIALEPAVSTGSVHTNEGARGPATSFGPLPQRVRIWLADFRAELTRANATDDEIEEALELLRAPQVRTFFVGGAPHEMTEEQTLEGMEAIATVVRATLKKRGRKVGR